MKSKYRNNIVITQAGRFDSGGEARRYVDLQILQAAGKISGLKRQVPIPLMCGDKPIRFDNGRAAVLRVDFSYYENGQLIFDDYKGYETPNSKLKRAICRAMGIEIRLSR